VFQIIQDGLKLGESKLWWQRHGRTSKLEINARLAVLDQATNALKEGGLGAFNLLSRAEPRSLLQTGRFFRSFGFALAHDCPRDRANASY